MPLIIAGWAFAGLIYFKVAFAAAYYDGISLVGTLLLSLVFGIAIFVASGLYAVRFFPINSRPGLYETSVGAMVNLTLLRFAGITLAFGVLSRLIIFGFSPRLSRQIRITGYWGDLVEEFVPFAIIVVVPMLLHYISCIWTTSTNRAGGVPNT